MARCASSPRANLPGSTPASGSPVYHAPSKTESSRHRTATPLPRETHATHVLRQPLPLPAHDPPDFLDARAAERHDLQHVRAPVLKQRQVPQQRRRRDFRHSLSAYLDLVTIILAGGGGLETALQTAADLGDGWAFDEIRAALRRARLTNRTPWDLFDELGSDLGIDELRELAASAHLAGDQGARIRDSLAAKADTMRANQTAALEAQAEAATEKMLLPVVTLVLGMILFIGFGVVQAISTPGTTP